LHGRADLLLLQLRIPAMADSGSGHDGQPRSEAT